MDETAKPISSRPNMDWLGLTISTLSAIAHAIKTVLLAVLGVAFSLVRLAAYPISVLWTVLLFVLSPVIYTIRFVLSPLFIIVNNFPRLEPIYIYFGSAAFVGIAFGLVFTLTSSSIASVLGLHDSPGGQEEKLLHAKRPAPNVEDEDSQGDRRAETPPKLEDLEQENLEALLASLDSQDSDLADLARQDWRDSPNTKRKRRSAAASRIGTILEEEDDSL